MGVGGGQTAGLPCDHNVLLISRLLSDGSITAASGSEEPKIYSQRRTAEVTEPVSQLGIYLVASLSARELARQLV